MKKTVLVALGSLCLLVREGAVVVVDGGHTYAAGRPGEGGEVAHRPYRQEGLSCGVDEADAGVDILLQTGILLKYDESAMAAL